MPQNPSNDQPAESIVEFKGLNDQLDSLHRPKGTVRSDQNILDDQILDASRRLGREFNRLEDGAIRFIYQFTWDDSGINLGYMAGSNGRNDAVTFPSRIINQANGVAPGPMPNYQYPIPMIRNEGITLPDFTSYIRALADARMFTNGGVDNLVWPDQIWGLDFYEVDAQGNAMLIESDVRTKSRALSLIGSGYRYRKNPNYVPVVIIPPSTLTPVDFYWVDYFCDANLIITHLTSIINNYNSVKNDYIKTVPIEGAATVVNFTAADNYAPGAILLYPATNSSGFASGTQFQDVANTLVALIDGNLTRIKITPTATDRNRKETEVINALSNSADFAFVASVHAATPWDSFYHYDNAHVFSGSTFLAPVSTASKEATNQGIGTNPHVFNARIKLVFNLSAYSNDAVNSVLVYLLTSPSGAGLGQLPRPTSANNVYSQWNESGITTVGSIFTTPYITGGDEDTIWQDPFSLPGKSSGWFVTSASSICVLGRVYNYHAVGIGRNGFPQLQVPAYETFAIQSSQAVGTSETFIQFGTVNRTNTGAADPTIYPTGSDFSGQQRIAASYTPSTDIQFSQDSLGFDPSRLNVGVYRPTICGSVNITAIAATGSPTTMAVKMYVNGTVVRTVSFSQTGGVFGYAFSIKDIGQFTSFRPPENNPGDNYNGWPNPPIVKISIAVNAGTISVMSCSVQDFVLNYPF